MISEQLTLVAQSRAVPRPKLFPATTTNDIRSSLYLVEASNMVVTTPDGWWVVYGPDLVWFFIRFFSLVCEKVPRDMTSLKVKNKLKILLMILLFCKPQISVGSNPNFPKFEHTELWEVELRTYRTLDLCPNTNYRTNPNNFWRYLYFRIELVQKM